MHRFYFSSISGEIVFSLKQEELVHQIGRVLRYNPGDECIFFNGVDTVDFVYSIKEIGKHEILFEFIRKIEKNVQNRRICLYQGMPNKWEKIELIIQKGVEVGIGGFVFFRSEWSQKLFINEGKIERMRKIMIEAVEQSGRNIITSLVFCDGLDVSKLQGQNILFHHILEANTHKLPDVLFQNFVNIFVGPEGGWSPGEVQQFESNSFLKVYFGETVLRCETVGIVIGFYIQNR